MPRALFQAGRLKALVTDFWAGAALRTLGRLTGSGTVRSLAGRFHPELDNAEVRRWNWRALGWEARLKRGRNRGQSAGSAEQYLDFIEVGRRFAICLREELKRRNDLGASSILFAYDTGALEAMECARARNIPCVLNQMDPNRVEVELVQEEERRWPGWALKPTEVPEEYFRRREQEWSLADRIVVNSQFCRDALLEQGVPSTKLTVVPLCYEPNEERREPKTENRKPEQPLRVLFLGQVILRKGIQYLIQAARLLEYDNIRFDVVGPIGLSRETIASAPKNVVFHGRAARDETARWYQQSDVFALPTLSDGFAITQLEAMAHGLPVITTPCCGEVVSDGVDGFVIPPRNAESLALALRRYVSEPDVLKSQQAAALTKSREFTVERLTENLLSLEQSLVRCSPVAGNGQRFADKHV